MMANLPRGTLSVDVGTAEHEDGLSSPALLSTVQYSNRSKQQQATKKREILPVMEVCEWKGPQLPRTR